MWHGGAVGSFVDSQLQCPGFDPELRLLSVPSFCTCSPHVCDPDQDKVLTESGWWLNVHPHKCSGNWSVTWNCLYDIYILGSVLSSGYVLLKVSAHVRPVSWDASDPDPFCAPARPWSILIRYFSSLRPCWGWPHMDSLKIRSETMNMALDRSWYKHFCYDGLVLHWPFWL